MTYHQIEQLIDHAAWALFWCLFLFSVLGFGLSNVKVEK